MRPIYYSLAFALPILAALAPDDKEKEKEREEEEEQEGATT